VAGTGVLDQVPFERLTAVLSGLMLDVDAARVELRFHPGAGVGTQRMLMAVEQGGEFGAVGGVEFDAGA
jgi:hypothetical protein